MLVELGLVEQRYQAVLDVLNNGATVSFAGARARTDSRGRAVIVRRLPTGTYRARACKASLACGSARVVAIPKVAAGRFAGAL